MEKELTFAEGIHLIVDVLLKNQLLCDLAQHTNSCEVLLNILDSLEKDVSVLKNKLESLSGA